MNFLKAKFSSTAEDGVFDPSAARRRRSTISDKSPPTSGPVSRHSRTASSVPASSSTFGQPADFDMDELTIAIWDTWNRKLEQLPVAKDLPRLAKKFKIYNSNNELINFLEEEEEDASSQRDSLTVPSIKVSRDFSEDDFSTASCSVASSRSNSHEDLSQLDGNAKPTTPIDNYEHQKKQNDPLMTRTIFSILSTLATELDEQVSTCSAYSFSGMTVELFDREVNISEHQSINYFLSRHFGEEGRVVRVLKACNQSMLAPAATSLKKSLLNTFDYKDIKGRWLIRIQMNLDGVTVSHSKTEQVVQKGKASYEELFCFEWVFSLHFKFKSGGVQTLELQRYTIGLQEVFLNEGISLAKEDKRKAAEEMLQKLLQVDVVFDDKTMSKMEAFKKKLRKSTDKK